jgi:tRNA(Ile)-lysidine synthase
VTIPARIQDLPPKEARLCLEVERFLLEGLRHELGAELSGGKILVAFSGGVDSTALLLVLRCLAPRLGFSLVAAHLNHNLRPEADDDAQAAQACCRELEIPCMAGSEDVAGYAREQGIGLEEAGRELRYSFLEQTRLEFKAQFVVTAHTLNDLAEDQLMRLLRGTGWPALGGMDGYDPGRRLLRPLLTISKDRLKELTVSLGVSWREDETNNDLSFLRNRVRSEILPLFLRENPGFLDSAAGLWRLARLDAGYWSKRMESLSVLEPPGGVSPKSREIPTCIETKTITIPEVVLRKTHPALRLRMFKQSLELFGKGQPLLENLLKLERTWSQGGVGKIFQFPGGKTAEILREGIVFRHTPIENP